MNRDACLTQIRYWSKALQQANKGIRRKNKYINRLERENDALRTKMATIHFDLAERMLGDI